VLDQKSINLTLPNGSLVIGSWDGEKIKWELSKTPNKQTSNNIDSINLYAY